MHALSSNRANTIARLALTARLLFQYGVGLGYYSNMASGSGALKSFGTTNYEQCLHLSEWVSDTFAYRSPRNKHVPTLRVSTSLKTRHKIKRRFDLAEIILKFTKSDEQFLHILVK